MAAKTRANDGSSQQALVNTGIYILIAGALAAGCVVGVQQLWRAVSDRPEFIVRPGDLALTSKWARIPEMKRDFLATDRTGILRRPGVSIFTARLCEDVAQAYAASPWVRRVLLVAKEFPNRLDVQLELREPYALVQTGSKCICVDEEGAPLSPQFYDMSPQRLASLIPVITLNGDCPVPNAGQPWKQPEVQEGLAMVRLYRKDLARNVSVHEIQVQRTDNAAVMATLVLDTGPRVQWGQTPAGPRSLAEISTAQKTTALLAITRKEGTQIGRLKTIDVRWPNPLCE
ncbi:MAG: hypothetical protein ABSA67_07645 [Candidatus Brocadiia bacterium]|jgi:cell division septal protein FtsQ